MTETIGTKLSALRERSGMSLREVAEAAGYNGASSVQVYFTPDYDRKPLGGNVAARLAEALAGKGNPPISREEVLALAQIDLFEVPYIKRLKAQKAANGITEIPVPTLRGQPRDVPVYGSALAADLEFDSDGHGPSAVEITNFSMGDVITWVRRPPGLDGNQRVYAVFVSGSSMEPRYRPGDPVFVDPLRPPAIGDDVIVQLAAGDESEEIVAGLIKTLVKRSSKALVLEQYRPELQFQVPMSEIARIHRVIPWREAFGM